MHNNLELTNYSAEPTITLPMKALFTSCKLTISLSKWIYHHPSNKHYQSLVHDNNTLAVSRYIIILHICLYNVLQKNLFQSEMKLYQNINNVILHKSVIKRFNFRQLSFLHEMTTWKSSQIIDR